MPGKAFQVALCSTKQLSDLPISQESGTCENLQWSLQLACMMGKLLTSLRVVAAAAAAATAAVAAVYCCCCWYF